MTAGGWLTRLGGVHVPTLLAGLACVAVLALFRWKWRRVPGAVVVFVPAMIAGRCVDFPAQLRDYVARLRARGIECVVAKPHLPLRETASAVGAGVLDELRHYSQLSDAVAAFRNEQPRAASPPSTTIEDKARPTIPVL